MGFLLFLRVVLRAFGRGGSPEPPGRLRSIAPAIDVSEGVVLGFVVGVWVEVSTFARGFGGYLSRGCLLFRLRFVQGGPYFEVRGYRSV